MYNMNPALLSIPGADGGGATPKTPEIVSTLMNMTDPFKHVRSGSSLGPRLARSPPSDSNTSASSSPPSLQHTRSQLIKEGLKLTIQSKRKNIGEPPVPTIVPERSRTRTISEDVSQDSMDLSGDGLTPEDEERRRQRRERNKIAATKCRMKKREQTSNLVHESEVLESQNIELKTQINELEKEKRNLVDLLHKHRPCQASPAYAEPYPRLKVEESSHPYGYPSTSSTTSSTTSYHHEVSRETYSSAMYHRQQEARYCRTTTASTSSSMYHYDDNLVEDPTVMLHCCSKPINPDLYMRADPMYSNLNVGSPATFPGSQDSPKSSAYSQPSSLSVATSSSGYESNADLLDSPNVPPGNYHLFDKDNSVYSVGFTTSSCIT